jgi:uncharacterized protein
VSFVIKQEADGILFDVQVVPRASRNKIGPVVGDRLKVQLTSPPVDGAANDALREVLGRALQVARSSVTIVRGETARKKTIRVSGVRSETLRAIVGD